MSLSSPFFIFPSHSLPDDIADVGATQCLGDVVAEWMRSQMWYF